MALPADIDTPEVDQFCTDIAALSERVGWSACWQWDTDHYNLTVWNDGDDRKGDFTINIAQASTDEEAEAIENWLSAIIDEVSARRA